MIVRNPITSFFGIVLGTCYLVGYFVPGTEVVCSLIEKAAMAGGLIAAADGK